MEIIVSFGGSEHYIRVVTDILIHIYNLYNLLFFFLVWSVIVRSSIPTDLFRLRWNILKKMIILLMNREISACTPRSRVI